MSSINDVTHQDVMIFLTKFNKHSITNIGFILDKKSFNDLHFQGHDIIYGQSLKRNFCLQAKMRKIV